MDIDQINIVGLSNSLRHCETDILEGRNKLSLTASLLQKINYALQELEYDHVSLSCSTTVPEEPVRFLQELIHKTPKLTITQRIKRETWRVDISRFTNLKYLELSKIPMHLVEGIQPLRSQLQVLICERCTDCLEEILGTPEHVWEELRTAKLCYNDFVFLCPFTNTPYLQYLDLSYNKIEDRLSLQTLKNLKYLNLSFNFLTSVPMFSEEVCHKLKVLLINNNYVQDLAAISVFDSLEVLDVSNNLLADHSAISPILFLPHLRSINLSNNPISYHPHHRFHTCSYLNKGVTADEFILDGRLLSLLEQKEIGRRGETFRHLGISMPRDLTCLPSSSLSQNQSIPKSGSRKKVREVVIEEGTSNSKPKVTVKPQEEDPEHLKTKRQLEELRKRFGGDHWLHSHAGSFVQDLLGLQKSTGNGVLSSTPVGQDFLPPSPKFVTALDKLEPLSSQFDSSASEDYVTAMTTQAIIEKIPKHVETSTPENSDLEVKEPVITIISSETQERSQPPDPEPVEEKLVEELAAEENKQPEEEEPEDKDAQLWLVQKNTEDRSLVEIFLTLNEKEIREKCTNTGCTTTRWSLESVESCEKVNNNPPTIHITFNTIRKACRERTYVMEYPDAQELLKRVRSFLEARSLSAMNQVAYRCMKCSSMFSVETQLTVLPTLATFENGSAESMPVTKCPTCGSTLVVEMEEAPLPSTDKACDCVPPSTSPIKHSPSDCSIGSAASLEQRVEVEPQGVVTPTPRRYDSDIEVISNPSQSSIEVLEVQARLQGSLTPNRKRSSEERPTVAVPQLNTVPEVQTNLVGLTESSSSGSLTDSVCTAYENNPVPLRRVGMSDVPEETTPTSTSTYTSLLEGLIQSVTSKLTPRNSPTVDTTLDNKVQYSYTDFSKVDHRVKFYLFENVFNDDNEELSFLLRGFVVSMSGEAVPSCLVVSTHSVYILHVVVPEIGDDASQWLQLRGCQRRADMSAVFALPWQLGAGFHLGSTVHLMLFTNSAYTCNLFKFLNNMPKQDGVTLQVEEEPSAKPERMLEQLVTRSVKATDGPVDSGVRHLTLCISITIGKDNEEVLKLAMTPLLITTTDLLLLQPNFNWLLPSADALPHSVGEQKLANIIDISLSQLQLQLHFLNEAENQEEVWSLELCSLDAVHLVVESIRAPWEQLFSVPLQLTASH